MHTHRDLFDQICRLENLLAAAHNALRGKRQRGPGFRFWVELEPEICRLHDELVSGDYRHGAYTYFTIHEPKEMGGVAIGASIGSLVPVVGTAAGGIVGGVLGAVGGGIGGTTAAKKLADKVVTDDQVPLMAVIQREFQRLAFEHVLTETETDALAAELQEVLTPKWFRTLYKKSASGTDESALLTMVQEELTPRFEAALERREWVALPDPNNVAQEIWIASEQICDASLPPF
jgi:hypothetical protein